MKHLQAQRQEANGELTIWITAENFPEIQRLFKTNKNMLKVECSFDDDTKITFEMRD